MLNADRQITCWLLASILALVCVRPASSGRHLDHTYRCIPFECSGSSSPYRSSLNLIQLSELAKFRAHLTPAVVGCLVSLLQSTAFLIAGTETDFARAAKSASTVVSALAHLRHHTVPHIVVLRAIATTARDQSAQLSLTLMRE